MAKRDYARSGTTKRKQQSSGKKTWLILTALFIVLAFAGALFFLKEKAPEKPQPEAKAANTPAKSVLPTPPEEVWSYIKALENRTVPVNDNKSLDNSRLTEEQKKVLRQMEEEQRQAELARAKLAAEKLAAEKQAQQNLEQSVTASDSRITNSKQPEAQKIPVVEAKEAKEIVKEVKKVEDAKKAEKTKNESNVKQSAVTPSTASAPTTNNKKFGLQCGAFKNRQQAESLQSRLAMLGFNARINSSADWNRVTIGPIGDRNATSSAQEKAKAVTNCVVIGM